MKNHIWPNLLLLLIACGGMLAVRIWHSDEWTFTFLLWNLFLTWVPVGAASLSAHFAQRQGWGNGLLSLLAAGVWLLFLPNSPYLITDLMHLKARHSFPLWYDSLMLFVFALAGLVGGLYSVRLIHANLHQRVGAIGAWGGIAICLGLTGFGVYLGRFQRWNSWDLWHHPQALALDCLGQLTNPFAVKVSLVFAAIMLLFYITFARSFVQKSAN